MVRIELPEKVEIILDSLMKKGYEAYAVGGCVRDSILGRIPGDWDITTSARPDEVKDIFYHTIDTGIEHGTVTVMLEKEGFEVTTYRIDGEYEDRRHPKNVAFTSDLAEDLKRRDFTINAMAYNHETGLVDIFDGKRDLERKMIRCVGMAEERFEEDALRILRAVRFAGQLGFSIDGETEEAIRKKASSLANISAERIRAELEKLILSKGPRQLVKASSMGILQVIFPEFDLMLKQEQHNPYHIYNVGEHAIKAVEAVNASIADKEGPTPEVSQKLHLILCFTMLLHDAGKPFCYTSGEDGIGHFYGHADKSAQIAKKVLKRLKCDNYTIDLAVRLIKYHDYRFIPSDVKMRRAANKIGPDIMELLFFVQRMDILAKNPEFQKEKLARLKTVEAVYQQIKDKKQCLTVKDLSVNGRDLIQAGIPSGPLLGETLHKLLKHVLLHPEDNEKEILLEYLKNL